MKLGRPEEASGQELLAKDCWDYRKLNSYENIKEIVTIP